jgi:hypothetical protein
VGPVTPLPVPVEPVAPVGPVGPVGPVPVVPVGPVGPVVHFLGLQPEAPAEEASRPKQIASAAATRNTRRIK